MASGPGLANTSPLGYDTMGVGAWTAARWILEKNHSLDHGMMSGSASRTWASGIGDGANPCSRTAPCKTFADAISKTGAGGEIDAFDPEGFGAITIARTAPIDAAGGMVYSTIPMAVDAWTVFPYSGSQDGCSQFPAGAEPRLTWKILNSGGVRLVITPLRHVLPPANRPSALPSMRYPAKPRWLRTITFTTSTGG
jgi:hypothetical protein